MAASRSIGVSQIAVPEVEREYLSRGINNWSDAQLLQEVAQVVARPRSEAADSFVLHAPLELAARAALLPRVRAEGRELARMRIVAIASRYEAFGPPAEVGPAPTPLASSADPLRWLSDALGAGDLDEVDRAAIALARASAPEPLAARLGDLILGLTGAAAHAPIFLYHLAQRPPRSDLSVELLRPLVRELARHPDWHLRWIEEWKPAGPTEVSTLADSLADTPIKGMPGSTFIHPLLMQMDEAGSAAAQLGPVVGRYSDAAARAVLRVAARSMLDDDPGHAPYGWSHCLTMPQAVLGISRYLNRPDRALAVAATQVAAFRAALGQAPLAADAGIDRAIVAPDDLATDAATSHDAHIVKYALACLDAAEWDPTEAPLYLAAGQHLLDVWAGLPGDPTDPLA